MYDGYECSMIDIDYGNYMNVDLYGLTICNQSEVCFTKVMIMTYGQVC